MDTMFFIDMVMSFFTSYQPGGDEEEQTNRKEIAIHYLRTWFILDLFAILPFDLIFKVLDFILLIDILINLDAIIVLDFHLLSTFLFELCVKV